MKLILMIGLVCSLMACSKDSGNSTPGGGGIDMTNFDTPTGAILADQDLTNKPNQVYNVGCMEVGKPGSQHMFDSRLKVGSHMMHSTKIMNKMQMRSVAAFTQGSITAEDVVSITPTNLVMNVTLKQAFNIPNAVPGMSYVTNCTVTDNNQRCTTTQPKALQSAVSSQFAGMLLESQCTLHLSTDPSDMTLENKGGSYTFANGMNVSAIRMVMHQKGTMNCGSQVIPVIMTLNGIMTNDLPAETSDFCGGRTIFASQKITTNGDLIGAIAAELLDFQ